MPEVPAGEIPIAITAEQEALLKVEKMKEYSRDVKNYKAEVAMKQNPRRRKEQRKGLDGF